MNYCVDGIQPHDGERRLCMAVFEDNEAVIKILQKGRSIALRHSHRTHRIGFDWLFDLMEKKMFYIKYISTKDQVADLMTKAFLKPETWQHLCALAQIRRAPRRRSGDSPAA